MNVDHPILRVTMTTAYFKYMRDISTHGSAYSAGQKDKSRTVPWLRLA